MLRSAALNRSAFETNLGWRPHAFANGTPGDRRREVRLWPILLKKSSPPSGSNF